MGVCNAIAQGMILEGATPEEAFSRFWIVDDRGLIKFTKNRNLADPSHQQFVNNLQIEGLSESGDQKANDLRLQDGSSLADVIRKVNSTILLGLSGVGGLFAESIIKEMKRHVQKPIIFAMSNPTHLSECTAEEVYQWTQGQVIFASGSPFDLVVITTPDGENKTFANNMFIYPGIGLGILS